jgi:hypothetical protein
MPETERVLLRPELAELPERMRSLPVDARAYPVPWFVAWVNGQPEFRAMDPAKWSQAVGQGLCWVCGKRLGSYLAFVIGPMCGINRTTSEPACHRECATWSARNCPFLSRPHMHRREDGTEELVPNQQGISIPRNPGVALVWVTRDYRIFHDDQGLPLIKVGEPLDVEFWAEGRPATRGEVAHSVATGLVLLERVAREQASAEKKPSREYLRELERRAAEFTRICDEAFPFQE